MAYSRANLDDIEKAIIDLVTFRQPVKFVIDGEVNEYPIHKLSELRAFRNEVAAEVNAADPSVETVSAIQIFGSKGL